MLVVLWARCLLFSLSVYNSLFIYFLSHPCNVITFFYAYTLILVIVPSPFSFNKHLSFDTLTEFIRMIIKRHFKLRPCSKPASCLLSFTLLQCATLLGLVKCMSRRPLVLHGG